MGNLPRGRLLSCLGNREGGTVADTPKLIWSERPIIGDAVSEVYDNGGSGFVSAYGTLAGNDAGSRLSMECSRDGTRFVSGPSTVQRTDGKWHIDFQTPYQYFRLRFGGNATVTAYITNELRKLI